MLLMLIHIKQKLVRKKKPTVGKEKLDNYVNESKSEWVARSKQNSDTCNYTLYVLILLRDECPLYSPLYFEHGKKKEAKQTNKNSQTTKPIKPAESRKRKGKVWHSFPVPLNKRENLCKQRYPNFKEVDERRSTSLVLQNCRSRLCRCFSHPCSPLFSVRWGHTT